MELNVLQQVIGIINDSKPIILKSSDIDFIKDLVADDGYSGYTIKPDGAGIAFNIQGKPDELFICQSNFMQLSKTDVIISETTLKNNLSKIFEVANRLKMEDFRFGFKLVGVNEQINSDKKINEECIKDKFLANLESNNIKIDGLGLRLVYFLKDMHINHYIEPYFKDKNKLYSIIDANSNVLKKYTVKEMLAICLEVADFYKRGLDLFVKE